jgi:hypothetical protein
VGQKGQDRDAKVRTHAHVGDGVMWFVAPHAAATPPATVATTVAASPAAALPTLPELSKTVDETGALPKQLSGRFRSAEPLPTVVAPAVNRDAAVAATALSGDLSKLLEATADIQKQVAETTAAGGGEEEGEEDTAPQELLVEEPDSGAVPKHTLKSRVHPSVFRSSADLADGVFSRLDSAEAARHAAEEAQRASLAKQRARVMAASHTALSVDPARRGESAYHQKHPLTVAMQTCQAHQHAAAVRCLNLGRGSCHNTWVGAYMSCFHVFSEAKSWLVRAGRLPHVGKPVKAPSAPLPEEVQRTAQLQCARAYSKSSQECHRAHRRSGALCRHFATRSGMGITAAAQAQCGSKHRQAQALCAHARGVGRASCESAWTTAKGIAMAQRKGKMGAAAAAHVVEPIHTRLQRAQMSTMARVEEASRRLQEARRTGMVKRGGEKTLLLELLGANGLGLALHGQQQHEQVSHGLLQTNRI